RFLGHHWDFWAVRVALISASVVLCYTLSPFGFHGLPAAGLGFLVAMVILLAELRLRRAEISGLMGGAVGVVLGLLAALLIVRSRLSRTRHWLPQRTKFSPHSSSEFSRNSRRHCRFFRTWLNRCHECHQWNEATRHECAHRWTHRGHLRNSFSRWHSRRAAFRSSRTAIGGGFGGHSQAATRSPWLRSFAALAKNARPGNSLSRRRHQRLSRCRSKIDGACPPHLLQDCHHRFQSE